MYNENLANFACCNNNLSSESDKHSNQVSDELMIVKFI